VPPSAAADGLVDHAIAADSVTYLNGGWTVSTEVMPPRPASCQFEPNTDYNHGVVGGHVSTPSKEACCAECAKDAQCAAAVFAPAGEGGSCWLKSVADVAKKSTQHGVTACVVKASPATHGKKISIPAKVPGDLITDLQAAGLVGDPLYELNWLNSSIWDANTWTYTTTFTAPAGAGTSLLVFDG
jgi:hypothetical protein